MTPYRPIAILGYGCVFPPDSNNPQTYWENVLNGTDGISDVSETFWKRKLYFSEDHSAEDKTYCSKGGKILHYTFPSANATQFGIPASETEKLNASQQMVLDTIIQAYGMMNHGQKAPAKGKVGMYLGNMLGDESFTDYNIASHAEYVRRCIRESQAYQQMSDTGRQALLSELDQYLAENFNRHIRIDEINTIHSALLGTVSRMVGAAGAGTIIDGACSGSGLVIDEAIKSLHNHDNEICIVSAVLGNMVVTGNIGFAKIGGLSKKNGSRPMDYLADGLIPGEGVGTLILKDLAQAMRDGDRIYGVIRGSGAASDGKGQSIYAPSSTGQLKAMQKSLHRSGLQAADIDYIETHATGTMVGDKIELNTIKMFFEGVSPEEKQVALGSVKSLIGHSFSAAGMANIVKVLEAMQRGIMPPVHFFTKLPDGVTFDGTGLYVNTEKKDWRTKDSDTPRRAMVNAFGFGGINANILLEEFVPAYHQALCSNLPAEQKQDTDIAIVGMGSFDAAEEEMKFPFLRFRIPPAILKQIDFGQQVGLIAADRAIQDFSAKRLSGEKIGVYVGAMLGAENAMLSDLRVRFPEYIEALENCRTYNGLNEAQKNEITEAVTAQFRGMFPKIEEDTLPGYMDNIIAGRIANFFDFDGANEVCDRDLLSFNAALYQAVYSLQQEENSLALAGCVHTNLIPEYLKIFTDEMQRNGLTELPAFQSGGVFFVLKRMKDVTAEDKIYARIRGVGFMQDPDTKTVSGTTCYLAADQGFRLLHEIEAQNAAGSDYSCTIKGKSLFGGSSYITFCGKDYCSSKSENTAQPEVWNLKTVYFGSETLENLFEHPCDEQEAQKLFFRAAIVYSTEEELNKRIGFGKKVVKGELS